MRRPAYAQFMRYVVVGGASNALGYLVFLWLAWWGGAPKLAMTLVYVSGALAGFVGNRLWTVAGDGRLGRTALRYALARVSGYGLI